MKRQRVTTANSADERILATDELLQRVPLRRQTIWRLVREGRFPDEEKESFHMASDEELKRTRQGAMGLNS